MEAFRLTIGHEMTHQEKDYFFFKPFSKAQKFVDWVNEVHADYGGIVKAFNGDVYRGIKALEFKEKCKGDKDKDGLSHPAWKRRREYVEKYDFNADLIKEIANFTGCNDKKLVESISNHYQGIELRR